MKLIVDNNILFAIMQPQSIAAYIFFTARNIEWFAPNFLWVEYKEYETLIMTKSGLSEHEFEVWLKQIQARITSVDLEEYKRNLRHAVKMIPDPDDAPYLALALTKGAAIWSNDKEYTLQSAIKIYTTKALVELLLRERI
ncbi:hypothetical protein J4208_03365 [Candidatus Woesearchaeota archaeon]|nr:hypothetical protein [Candidatus Woesearchaeota archaeon]